MKNLPSSCLIPCSINPHDVTRGERVIIYLDYPVFHDGIVEVREGFVLDPNDSKKGFLTSRHPSLKMRVERSWVLEYGEVKKRSNDSYTRSYFYKNIQDIRRV